ncbi:lysozyme inhibitor LprI family protein [Microbulbifer taiwanensis]|uniref:Lysozyme inhibitor LprI family protein n=1 Tax=Microbulbifer taiwanensis TaxID=986746 RepID=A0ABW1YPR7_9GAMM|nr:lysozyme inhibitor LprI family protein [Microbulbifer taiwanensis]
MKRLLLIALAVSASALADDRGSSWQEGCRPDEQTQLELNQCAQRYYQSRDAELNKVYKTTMQSLPAEQQKRLREQQRAWLKSRDPDCRAQVEAEAAGGSILPMLYSLCLAEATARRTQQLRDWHP